MNAETINGLNKTEVWVLYQFLVDYENKYKSLTSDNFMNSFPEFKELDGVLQLDKKSKAEMKENVVDCEINQVYMTESKQLNTFLKHLRNAYAHSILIKNDNR